MNPDRRKNADHEPGHGRCEVCFTSGYNMGARIAYDDAVVIAATWKAGADDECKAIAAAIFARKELVQI